MCNPPPPPRLPYPPFTYFHLRLSKVIADFNETRASDIFVINFGAHFPDDVEGEEKFKRETASVLDDMATLGETATVVWR